MSSRAWTKSLIDSRNEVMNRMFEEARVRGGNAVIAMRFDTSEMGPNWTEICAYGTAVVAVPVSDAAKQTATALGYGQPGQQGGPPQGGQPGQQGGPPPGGQGFPGFASGPGPQGFPPGPGQPGGYQPQGYGHPQAGQPTPGQPQPGQPQPAQFQPGSGGY